MKDPKLYAIIGLLIYILFLHTCKNDTQSIISEVTTVHSDTLRVTHVDTLQFVDTIQRIVTVKIEEPVRVIIEDDVWDELDINEYTNPFSDSLVDGSIWTKVDGTMLDQKFDYTPKFPKYIFQVDTVIVNTSINTVQTVSSKLSLNIGAEAGGGLETFNFSPKIGFNTNNGFSYSYRYGIIDKTHNIGIMYNFKIK